ncbi:MAG: NADH-quinone oxidoreductase subunit M [Anaerolineales bacterium]|jgi:NADH-quinone oxidoreductase subunit M
MTFPILTIIIFTPLVTGLIILLLPAERKGMIRGTALAGATLALLLSVVTYFSYDTRAGGYQFVEKVPWVPEWGISYHVGVNGLNLPLVLLTGLVMFTGVLISWGIEERTREFFAFLFVLATGVFGAFVSLDLFQLFFFYELAVFPMYLLISLWGWPKMREYAAMKLTLYLFVGSVLALVGALAMYFASGLHTFDMLELQQAGFSSAFQRLWFPVVFLGFAVLGGLFPLHNWSPDGYAAAPTAASMFHAGVLKNLGAFAAFRVAVMLFPEAARFYLPWVVVLALINVIYASLIAMVQTDLKYVIGFSSVSHMGLVMMGFASLSATGILGAGLQMFSHGVMTALFFAVVGMVYDRAHTREIPQLGGFAKKMPLAAVTFTLAGLASMGMPGLSGFVAEFPLLLGVWQRYPLVAILAAIGVVVTAAYILLLIRRVFFGSMPAELEHHVGDITVRDKAAIILLAFILVALGVYPGWMAPLVQSGAAAAMKVLGV